MGRIIALKGRGNTGKTTTMSIVRRMLLDDGYVPAPHQYFWFGDGDGGGQAGRDFRDVLLKEKIKIGITSAGDTRDLLKEQLDYFVEVKCDIILCACRTKGEGVDLLNEYRAYSIEFVSKTYSSNDQEYRGVNRTDAQIIIAKIS